MKVYLLYEDNGQSYEDNSYDVVAVYASKDKANEAAQKFNDSRNTPIYLSKEEFESKRLNEEYNLAFWSDYEEYKAYEEQQWSSYESCRVQYIKDTDLIQ